jgi:hypothetical protein
MPLDWRHLARMRSPDVEHPVVGFGKATLHFLSSLVASLLDAGQHRRDTNRPHRVRDVLQELIARFGDASRRETGDALDGGGPNHELAGGRAAVRIR